MKPFKMSLMLVVLLGVCSSKNDLLAAPYEKLPKSISELIKEKYPSATAITMSVLEKGKVYRSRFKVGRVPISVVANSNGILLTERLAGENLSDSVQAKLTGLAIAGGVSSNHRFVEVAGRQARLEADYLLNGVKYTLAMESNGYVQLSTRTLSYETKSLTDLPATIQKFINERNKPNLLSLLQLDQKLKQSLLEKKELVYESCSVFQLPNGAKQYQVYVKYFGLTTLPLIFDEKANLVWTGSFNRLSSLKNFDDLTGGSTNISDTELTTFKNRFTEAPESKSFTLGSSVPGSVASLNVYGDVTGYEFNLVKPTKGEPGNESWHMSFDNNRTMIDAYYSGQVR